MNPPRRPASLLPPRPVFSFSSRFFLTLALSLLIASALLAVDQAEAESRARDFMVQQGVAPIEVKPGTRFQRDLDEDWLKWAERTIVTPFAKRAATRWPAHEKEAVDFVRQAMRFRRTRTHPDPGITPLTLRQRGAALLAAKVDDPLIMTLQASALLKSRAALQLLENAAQIASTDYPASERLMLWEDLWDVERSLGIRTHSYGERRLDAAIQVIEDPAVFTAEDDEVLVDIVNFIFEPAMFTKRKERILQACDLPSLSPWTFNVLHGYYENAIAWEHRGGGFANQVTEDGWLGFRTHLPKAREFFYKAWELHPGRPAAPAALVGIVNAGGGVEGETPRLWFDHTIAAQFDRMDVYNALVTSYRPRWGGSIEKMKAFGLACALTGRHDTLVPEYVLFITRLLAIEKEDWQSVFHDALLRPALLTALEAQAANPARAWERDRLQADYAICAWACRDFPRANEVLRTLKLPFPPESVTFARTAFKARENDIRNECALHVAGKLPEWRTAESAYHQRQLDTAATAYEAIASAMGKDTPLLVTGRIASVKTEKALATGEWVRLNVTPALEDWTVHKGRWEGATDGVLVHRGADDAAMITHNARVGPDFDMRGEYEVESAPGQDQGLGIILGYAASASRNWLLCTQFRHQDNHAAALLHQFQPTTTPTVTVGKLPVRRTFDIRCLDGKVTYIVNEQEVVRDYLPSSQAKPDAPLTILPNSSIGFTNWTFPKDTITRLLKAEVRLIKR